jgi:hypothetical protein
MGSNFCYIKIKYFINIYCSILFYIMISSLSPTQYLNGGNVHGGAYTTDQTGGVANAGNTAFGATGGSPAALRGAGLYSVTGVNGSPSAVKTQMGGGRRHKNSAKRSRKNKRSNSSKKYARKRSLKYRIKHRRSRRYSHSKKVRGRRAQAGGYHQYMGNTPFTLGYRTPGFNLAPNMSSLANPAPFMPYNSLTGGR